MIPTLLTRELHSGSWGGAIAIIHHIGELYSMYPITVDCLIDLCVTNGSLFMEDILCDAMAV